MKLFVAGNASRIHPDVAARWGQMLDTDQEQIDEAMKADGQQPVVIGTDVLVWEPEASAQQIERFVTAIGKLALREQVVPLSSIFQLDGGPECLLTMFMGLQANRTPTPADVDAVAGQVVATALEQ